MKTFSLKLKMTLILFAIFASSIINAQTLPVTEDFNAWHNANGWNITEGWTVETLNDWNFSTEDENFPTASNGYLFLYQSSDFGAVHSVISDTIDISTATNGVELSWYQSLTTTSLNLDIKVEISTDLGVTWETVHAISGNFSNQLAVENLSSYTNGKSSLIVKWSTRYLNGTGTAAKYSIDDITIRKITAIDLGVTAINSPNSSCSLENETVEIEVKNWGTTQITADIPVEFSTDGGNTWVSENLSGGMFAGATQTYTFTATADLSNVQSYNFMARTNYAGDEESLNDAKTINIVNEQTIASYPYNEDYETNDGGWHAVSGNTVSSWEWGEPNSDNLVGGANNSTNAWATNLTGNHIEGEQSYVYSPCFDFSSLNSPIIEFDLWYIATNYDNTNDGMILEYSVDYGQNWVQIGNVGTGENWYSTAYGWFGTSDWVHAKHEIDALAGETNVKFRFNVNTPAYNWTSPHEGYAFDNFKIYDKPAYDVGAIEWTLPQSSCELTNAEMVRIKIKNYGTQSVSDVPVEYSIDGGNTFVQDVVAGPIAPDAEAQFIFYTSGTLADFSTPGVYNCVLRTALATDENTQNDAINYTVISKPVISTEITENFDNDYAGYWNTYLESGIHNDWQHGVPMGDTISTAASGTKAWVTNLTGTVAVNQTSYVESPCYDLSAMSHPVFEFKIALHTYVQGKMWVEYTIDGGANWNVIPGIPSWMDQTTWYADNYPNFAGDYTSGEWQTKYRSLVDVADVMNNLSDVKFRVAFQQGVQFPQEGVGFDDVKIYNNPALSVIENETDNNINIYPNPANNIVNISLNTDATIEIANINGQTLYYSIDKNKNFSIDIANYKSGVYFVKIKTNNSIKVEKLIIE